MILEIEEPLEAAYPHMAVIEPHQHARSRRRGLVSAHQAFACFDEAE